MEYASAESGAGSSPRRSADCREKSGRTVTPKEKHVAKFRMLKKSVDSSNTLFLPALSIEADAF
jgi:hypothetical protein